jgi:hypothetical protein
MAFSFDRDPTVAEQQMHALIFSLTAFGYIDGDFATSEKEYIRDYIGKLVRERARLALGSDLSVHGDVIAKWTSHFHEVLDGIDGEIQALFGESVAEGEDTLQFVTAKLKLRAFELFKKFDESGRSQLLATVDELMHADGVVQPSELKFRNELSSLLEAPMEIDDLEIEPIGEGHVVIEDAMALPPRELDHPFLRSFEHNYATDKETFGREATADLDLIRRCEEKLEEQRTKGRGKLAGAKDVGALAGGGAFLDGHVFVVPPEPGKDYELLVLGDLHGCYSCLKAALLQADFFAKVLAHQKDPDKSTRMMLVLLGDYIDRGRFSYNGILRTVMQLYLAAPENVFPLRGNHEYYIEYKGRVLAPVRPAEAMTSLEGIAPVELFASYMRLFEALPNLLFFDRTLFVHAGIPREDTIAEKFSGLSSLNDNDLRFQMLWSDPSEADAIPLELQKANARFPFGKQQFRRFMARLGCTTMVRGHERIVEGFRRIYDDPEAALLSLFSAGGANNGDLPESSNYREVTPMALTIRHKDGVNVLTPFAIEYERFNDPRYNAFFRESLGGGG